MRDPLLTNALAHEFMRCTDAFELFVARHAALLAGDKSQRNAIGCYNAYADFIAHLYEFYLGCIKDDSRFPGNITGVAVDSAINAEVEKLYKIKRDRILRGDAPSYENHISYYEASIPADFGAAFRAVRNLRSHAGPKRSEFDLATFYRQYHRFVYALYEAPQWLWKAEKFPTHSWLAITDFAAAIAPPTAKLKS